MDIKSLVESVVYDEKIAKSGYHYSTLTLNLARGVNVEYLLTNDQAQLVKLLVGLNKTAPKS